MNSSGRFARVLNRRGCFGIVEVEIDPNSATTSIAVQIHDQEEDNGDVPERGYEDWKQGAVLGVAFALWTTGQIGCAVVITRIMGTDTDTNPTIIAAAAMDAVWNAFGFTPEPALTTKIEENVVASSSLPIYSACIPW